MKPKSIVSLIFGLLFFTGYSFAQQFNYVAIDVQCDASSSLSDCPAGIAPGGSASASWASGVSPGGRIVGGYMGTLDGLEHGYVYDRGKFTTIDAPGSLVGLSNDVKLETEVNGINPAGDMVGDYFARPGDPGAPACVIAHSPPCDRGFLYKHGQFYSILIPNGPNSTHFGSIPSSITPDGSIYGCLHDQNLTFTMFGFVRTHSGDFKTLETGGGEVADPSKGYIRSMNNAATPDGSIIVGLYFPPGATRAHGFTVQNGVLTDYMFPGSLATQLWGINPNADVVGIYRDHPSGSFAVHGFLQPGDGSAPIPINFTDPVTQAEAVLTQALGINPAGAIVGIYLDSNGGEHGFLAVPTTGN